MKHIIIVFSFFLFFQVTFSTSSFGQKKVLGKPTSFVNPIDYFDAEDKYTNLITNGTSPKLKKMAWMVISDRKDNVVFDKPAGKPQHRIGLGEIFYVTAEKGEWIEIVSAQVDKLKIVNLKKNLGWINKKKMLLWNSGVIGERTGIHRKVLLLNHAEDIRRIIEKKDKSVVDVYSGPETVSKQDDRKVLDEFYFVLKRENDRILIAEDALISNFNAAKIVGWISERDCEKWDTRVCLEPNYTADAFNERASNKAFHIKAFKSINDASEYAERNSRNSGSVFWENDPVKITSSLLSRENPRRFNGQVIRFPMVNMLPFGSKGLNYYETGVVGRIHLSDKDKNLSEMEEPIWAQLKKNKDVLVNKTNKVNIFFMIEGTESTFPYQAQIANSIRTINSEVVNSIPEVNYGALIYRDIPEESLGRLTEHVGLTPDINKVVNFINTAEFKSKVDRDEYTALYYGLEQTLKVGNFDKNHLNIIILIGCNGDLRTNRARKAQATGHKALISNLDPLIASLSELNTHFYSIQLKNEGFHASKSFNSISHYLMLESAKYTFNTKYGKQDYGMRQMLNLLKRDHSLVVKNPSMELDDTKERIALLDASTTGGLTKPLVSRQISPSSFTATIKKDIRNSIDFTKGLKDIISSIVDKGNAPDESILDKEVDDLGRTAGDFTPALALWLHGIMSEGKVPMEDILQEKYKLFTRVYIPEKYNETIHPTISYVLFMPEMDVYNYLQIIKKCLATTDGGAYDDKREKLFEVYKSLIEQFTGKSGKDLNSMTRNDLIKIMQGIEIQGLKLGNDLDYVIPDILNKRKVTDEEIDTLLNRFNEVQKRLDDILRQGETYEFSYTSDQNNRYYWIPLSEVF